MADDYTKEEQAILASLPAHEAALPEWRLPDGCVYAIRVAGHGPCYIPEVEGVVLEGDIGYYPTQAVIDGDLADSWQPVNLVPPGSGKGAAAKGAKPSAEIVANTAPSDSGIPAEASAAPGGEG